MNYKYNKYKDKYNYLKILYGGTQIKLLIEKKLWMILLNINNK